MSFVGDLDSFPSMPRMPDQFCSAYQQAQALLEVCTGAGVGLARAARLLGLSPRASAWLQRVLLSSYRLQEIIREGAIPLEPAAMLAKLEKLHAGEALVLARRYRDGEAKPADIEAALERRRAAAKRRGR